MNTKTLPKTAAIPKSPKTAKPVVSATAPTRDVAAAGKKAASPAVAAKPKHKLVRDSFTIPKLEYTVLESLKVRAASLARPVKKSELLRAGISALNAMGDKAFLAAMNGVPSLKTGRPSGAKPVAPATKGEK